MRSLLAIVSGSIFIIVVIMILQLAYLFIAIEYKELSADYPLLKEIAPLFRYIVALPVFATTLFAGGYITANIVNMDNRNKVWIHCFFVGLITVGGMMYSALINANLTFTGIVATILAFVALFAGGSFGLKRQIDSQQVRSDTKLA
ncbi:MAG: hypothetical protein OQK78_10585 [Gammaproteobacteria bacterium]|nr:hypothetical protein [Gammaproteobacteria bacterium]